MPELPEVEVTRLSIDSRLRGALILGVGIGKPLRWPLGCSVDRLVGQRVQQVGRRGKYLRIDLSDGVLLVHLGMSGSLQLLDLADLAAPGAHDHFDLLTQHGCLRLHDPRRFGAVVFSESVALEPAAKLLASLGPEPLGDDFTAASLRASLARHSVAIKQVLLAGRAVVGVGNIYASEVLFLSGIRPTRPANCVTPAEATRLHVAIKTVLARAIDKGGTTLRDFSNASGHAGHFQNHTRVYGRGSMPCLVCEATIQKIQQGQRSTFFCPLCQRR